MNINVSKSDESSGTGEISLYDLWQLLTEGWHWIIGGAIVGLIAAATYLLLVPPQYEATALIQIGQIAQFGQTGQSQASMGQFGRVSLVPVEPQIRVLERILQPSFKTSVLNKLGWGPEPRAALYFSSFKAAPAKSAELIELKMMAFSRDDAERAISGTIGQLAAAQRIISKPAIERLQSQLTEISTEITEMKRTLTELDRLARQQGLIASRDRLSEYMFYVQMSSAKTERLKELRHFEAQCREAISLTGKAEAVALDATWVSETPVFPKKTQTLLLATMGGLFLGVVMGAFRRGLQNRRSAAPHVTEP